MGDGPVELPQPTQDQATASVAARPVELQRQYEQVALLGRRILAITKQREDNRYTPLTNSQRFINEDIAAVKKQQSEVTSESDVAEATRGSYALALEAATQIGEFRAPPNMGIREDTDSLKGLIQVIRAGGTLNQDLIKQNPSLVVTEMRKLIAIRQRVTPDKVQQTDEQLLALADQQFNKAFGSLNQKAQALAGYHGR